MIQRAAASQKRLNEFLSIHPTIQTKTNPTSFNNVKGEISFDQVNFIYPHSGIKALSSFNLNIQSGQKVLILGKTGAGKSSIAQLITRMYDPNTGSIKIDGTDIRNFNVQDLRKAIGYVQQDVFLFSDSVKNNIQFGVDQIQSESQLMNATTTANVYQEIKQLNKQFETLIGERGTTLSGGQKQRVSIARTIIKNPSIYIFDDCLSAVDAKTEQSILGQLSKDLEGKTALFITHRIFFSFNFDLIIYLQEGNIAEIGTHESLLAQNGLYAELYNTQKAQKEE
jgi:ATP-binding cassette subfamily B protein